MSLCLFHGLRRLSLLGHLLIGIFQRLRHLFRAGILCLAVLLLLLQLLQGLADLLLQLRSLLGQLLLRAGDFFVAHLALFGGLALLSLGSLRIPFLVLLFAGLFAVGLGSFVLAGLLRLGLGRFAFAVALLAALRLGQQFLLPLQVLG